MQSIIDLIGKHQGVETVSILGDAPTLKSELNYAPIDCNSFIIAMSRSFIVQRPTVHFFGCQRFVDKYKDKFDYSLDSIHPKSFGEYGFRNEYYYRPVRDVEIEATERLRIGHCVLVPALHFACLLGPVSIRLYGVEMIDLIHWDNPKQIHSRFPARNRVCEEVRLLRDTFPKTTILSVGKKSMLVRAGILRVA